MAAITTCRNWTAMHNSAPVGPPSRSRAIRWSLFEMRDRKSTRLNSSHGYISYAVFCLKKKKTHHIQADHHFIPEPHNTPPHATSTPLPCSSSPQHRHLYDLTSHHHTNSHSSRASHHS